MYVESFGNYNYAIRNASNFLFWIQIRILRWGKQKKKKQSTTFQSSDHKFKTWGPFLSQTSPFPSPSSSIPNLFVFMLFADSVVKHSLSWNRFSSPGMSSLSSKLGHIWGSFCVLSPFLLSGPLQGGRWLTNSPLWTSSSPPSRCLVMPRFFLEVRRLFVNLMCSYFRMWLVRMFGINWTIIWNFEFG